MIQNKIDTRKKGELGDLLANAASTWLLMTSMTTNTDIILYEILPKKIANYKPAETRMGDMGNSIGVGAYILTLLGVAAAAAAGAYALTRK